MSNSPTFDPTWEPIYDSSKRLMSQNTRAVAQQVDLTSAQVQAITEIIVTYERELHEIRSSLDAVEQTERILENTSPVERRGPGRPPKTQGD